MSEQDNEPERVTIIKQGGSGGGIIVGVLIALAIALLAWLVLSGPRAVDPSDASVAAAADKVGAAADQVGQAAQDAVKKIR